MQPNLLVRLADLIDKAFDLYSKPACKQHEKNKKIP